MISDVKNLIEATDYRVEAFVRLGLSLLVLSSTHCLAQVEGLQPKPGFQQIYRNEIPVGGHLFGGMFYPSSNPSLDLSNLQIELRGPRPPSNLCMLINSIDGRYEASGSYEIENKANGTYRLLVPPDPKRDLSRYDANSLAVLVWPQSPCNLESAIKADLEIVPVSWGNPQDTRILVLLLNALGQDSEVQIGSPGGSRNPCTQIQRPDLPTIAFDTLCKLSPVTHGENKMTVLRWKFERALPPARFRVLLP